MQFIEKRFIENLSLSLSGGITFSTDVAKTASGGEIRNINWYNPLRKYKITSGFIENSEIDEIIAFFTYSKGSAIGFRFKDWNDFAGQNQIIGIGNGASTEFQLQKTYSFNNDSENSYKYKITKPVEDSVTMFGDNENGFEVNYKNGRVKFFIPPASGIVIKANFEFDIPVRFVSDSLEIKREGKNMSKIENLEIIEIRSPEA